MQYCFILGNNPTLSILEILSVFKLFKNKIQIISFSDEILLVDIESEFLIDNFLSRLGGTIKIGKIEKKYLNINELNIEEILKLFRIQENKKVYFGLSFYNLNADHFLKIKENLKKLGLIIKRELQEKGLKARWVVSQEKNLSSVVVEKNKLIKQGAEILILIDKNKIYLGKTIAVQSFEKYSERDCCRPIREIQKGMLPPKLSQIIINLGQIKKDCVILDPFCGSGTVLQEAILMGYKNIIGSDIDSNSVETTKKNLEWLLKKFEIQNLKFKIFQCNATNLSKNISFNSVDAIVSEPYLGPIRNIENIKNTIYELSKLYLKSFEEFKKILKKQGVVVIIFPVFKNFKNEFLFLPILDALKKQGWKIDLELPKELFKNNVIKITSQNSIIYSRPEQRVLREIFVFRF